MNDWNTVNGVCCKPWLVLPAVYSDALSYGDQIAQFCSALNKVIQNNNNLPDYVQQMIQEYISGGVIGEIVQNVVSQFILNVKYPPEGLTPAVGDGSEDDTVAVQGCIDYASEHNGMAVYFPSGAYSVQSLTLKSEVSLFGFDRYSTKLVLRGGATTPMISLNGSNCGIYNLTLDGNAGVQVENINVVSMIAQDVYLDGLILQNGYQLLVYNGTGGHLQVNDVVFGNAVYRAVGISGNSVVQAKGLKFNQLSAVSGSDVINISSDGGTYDFISNVSCETCLSISGNDNYITGIENGATNGFVDSGLRNTIDFKGGEKKEYYNGSTDTTIEGGVSFTTNGAYSENISGAFTSIRNSSESKVVTEASVEQYKSTQTENVTGKKTINAQDIDLNPDNPLTYKTPLPLNQEFKYIPFKDRDNNIYQVLVANNISDSIIDISKEGCVGDGITDNTTKLQNIINTNTGKIIFIPSGTFLISNTITLPSNTIIIGSGFNSVIKANTENFDMFVTENFYNLTGTDTHDSAVGNWYLNNFVIDGNYYTNIETNTLSGRSSGRGLSIYGNNYYLINMVISNNPGIGLWMENNTYDNPAYNLMLAGEWTLDKCVIKFNGEHGVYSHNVFDYHMVNCTVASNSRKGHGLYDNFRISGGNVKCTTCHFYTNYGSIKPNYSVNIDVNSGRCVFINCHIEGAITPLYIGAEYQSIIGCSIYASFGEYDCIIANGHCIIDDTYFLYQVQDAEPEKPEWVSAIQFKNSPRNCYIKAFCINTPLIADMTNCGYINIIKVYGYNNSNVLNNTACEIDTSKADYEIYGDFGEQSEYKELSSANNYTTIGAPDALQYDYFSNMTGDVTFNNNVCTIINYTSGTVTIGEWGSGRVRFLINKSSSQIPFNTNGITIDNLQNGNIAANSIFILIANTEKNYSSINLHVTE